MYSSYRVGHNDQYYFFNFMCTLQHLSLIEDFSYYVNTTGYTTFQYNIW